MKSVPASPELTDLAFVEMDIYPTRWQSEKSSPDYVWPVAQVVRAHA
jgi:hypothetical protein